MKMRKIFVFFTAAMMIIGLFAGCAEQGELPKSTQSGQTGPSASVSTDIDEGKGEPAISAEKSKYRMDVTLEEEGEKPSLNMTIQVTVKNDSNEAWKELCFRDFMKPVHKEARTRTEEKLDFDSGIKSASSNGTPLDFRMDEKDPSIIYVELAEPLANGESAEVVLEYQAHIPDGGFRCAYSSFNYGKEDRTYELAQFYPMLAAFENGAWVAKEYIFEGETMYSRCADYEITLHAPEKYEVIASGQETKGETEDGITTWKVQAENMRDVTIVLSNEYESASGEACGVKVTSYYAKENGDDGNTRQGEISLKATMDAIEAYTAAYGPYPYGELDVVESSYEYGGMEAPGLVRISQLYSWSLGKDVSEAERKEGEEKCAGTVAHEVAHEWFYAAVGNDQYNEAWLDESFAAFNEQVYWRHVGRSEEKVAEVMEEFLKSTPAGGEDVTVDRPYDALHTDLVADYVAAVYKRGAGFLYKLEQSMGQEEFYDFMKKYYGAYSFKEAHTEDFLNILTPYIKDNQEAKKLVNTYLSRANSIG